LLPKRERISRGSEIAAIRKRKQFHLTSPLLYIIGEENKLPYSRMAVICRAGIGNAVERNRTKRIITAAYANIRHKIDKNMNLLLMPKAKIKKQGQLLTQIMELLRING
jgi:ribonuclease P protein component